MNRVVLAVGIALVAPTLVVLALGLRHDPQQVDSPLIGLPAPAFALADLDGEPVSLAALRGKPVVLNFWATYCPPCRVEHPILRAAAARYAGRVHFVGVIYQDTPEAIRAYEASRGAWGYTLVDPRGRTALAYGVFGVPETYFISADGTVTGKVVGAVSPSRLETALTELLG